MEEWTVYQDAASGDRTHASRSPIKVDQYQRHGYFTRSIASYHRLQNPPACSISTRFQMRWSPDAGTVPLPVWSGRGIGDLPLFVQTRASDPMSIQTFSHWGDASLCQMDWVLSRPQWDLTRAWIWNPPQIGPCSGRWLCFSFNGWIDKSDQSTLQPLLETCFVDEFQPRIILLG